MSCSSIDYNDLRVTAPESIELEPDAFEQAACVSAQVFGESCQWQTYINALGLQGFTQWLNEQDANVVVDQEHCSIFYPPYANAIEAICNLQIGEFRLCLVATENLLNETVTIPRAAIDLPDFAAHFYGVVEVQEEQKQVIIRGYGRYDQLINYRRLVNLTADNRWTYSFPLSLFDPEPNHLLFNTRFLDSAAIALPSSLSDVATAPIIQTKLTDLLTHLHSPKQRLWQILSWQQGAKLLQSPQLLGLLYQWQQSSQKALSLRLRITEVFTLLTQQTLNTARWLQGELDQLSQGAGWYSRQMQGAGTRSNDKFTIALAELRYQGMDIPAQLNPAFKTIEFEGALLQLYAVTWALTDATWTLLLMLRNQMGTSLPDGLKLCVADLSGAVNEQEDALDTELLYVRAEVSYGVKLVATIVSSTGQVLPLEPYTFAEL